jgi:Na+/melibiose symporter-like transporter
MIKVYGKRMLMMLVFFLSFVVIYQKSVYAQDDKKAEEIRKKIQALEEKKSKNPNRK